MEGTDLVLTGHTLDDQIETVDMRRARGAKGPGDGRGLAGMAPATLYDGRSWLLRPLLGTERAALRAWLTERAIGWIDDPTNVDSKYERARLRAATAIGQDTQSARSRIAAAASERAALGEAAAALIRTHAKLAAPGLVRAQPGLCRTSSRRSGGLCTAHHACGHRRYGAASRCQERRCAVRAHRSGELPLDAVTGGDRRHGTRDLSAPGRARLARTFGPALRRYLGRALPDRQLAGRNDARARRNSDCSSDHGCIIRCRVRHRAGSGEVGTGDRAGAVARRSMPGSGGRVRHGAANYRALGALPALVRPCAGPRGGGTCRRRYCRPSRHSLATKSAKGN